MTLHGSRKEALSTGATYYFTGKPCKHGHVTKRYSCNGACLECDKAHVSHYYSKNKEIISNYFRGYRSRNRAILSEKDRTYRMEKHETIAEKKKVYRTENAERISEVKRDWRKANKNRVMSSNALRRSRKRNATPGWFGEFDEFVVSEAYSLCEDRARATGNAWHVDHMIPLLAKKACGLHVSNNIQVIPEFVNLSKGNRLVFTEPMQWLSALQ